MFGFLNIGPLELILVLVMMLIVFGPGKLPEVAKSLGKAMREFRKASSNVQRVWDDVTSDPEKFTSAKTDKEEKPEDQSREEAAGGEQSGGAEGGDTQEETGDQAEEQVEDDPVPEDSIGNQSESDARKETLGGDES